MQIAEALRLLRTRQGLTQTAASRRNGAPDYRTLSHWETGRKLPSFKLLSGYLASLGFDLHDFQDAIDLIAGRPPERFRDALRGAERRLEALEDRVGRLEDRVALPQGPPPATDEVTERTDGRCQAPS